MLHRLVTSGALEGAQNQDLECDECSAAQRETHTSLAAARQDRSVTRTALNERLPDAEPPPSSWDVLLTGCADMLCVCPPHECSPRSNSCSFASPLKSWLTCDRFSGLLALEGSLARGQSPFHSALSPLIVRRNTELVATRPPERPRSPDVAPLRRVRSESDALHVPVTAPFGGASPPLNVVESFPGTDDDSSAPRAPVTPNQTSSRLVPLNESGLAPLFAAAAAAECAPSWARGDPPAVPGLQHRAQHVNSIACIPLEPQAHGPLACTPRNDSEPHSSSAAASVSQLEHMPDSPSSDASWEHDSPRSIGRTQRLQKLVGHAMLAGQGFPAAPRPRNFAFRHSHDDAARLAAPPPLCAGAPDYTRWRGSEEQSRVLRALTARPNATMECNYAAMTERENSLPGADLTVGGLSAEATYCNDARWERTEGWAAATAADNRIGLDACAHGGPFEHVPWKFNSFNNTPSSCDTPESSDPDRAAADALDARPVGGPLPALYSAPKSDDIAALSRSVLSRLRAARLRGAPDADPPPPSPLYADRAAHRGELNRPTSAQHLQLHPLPPFPSAHASAPSNALPLVSMSSLPSSFPPRASPRSLVPQPLLHSAACHRAAAQNILLPRGSRLSGGKPYSRLRGSNGSNTLPSVEENALHLSDELDSSYLRELGGGDACGGEGGGFTALRLAATDSSDSPMSTAAYRREVARVTHSLVSALRDAGPREMPGRRRLGLRFQQTPKP